MEGEKEIKYIPIDNIRPNPYQPRRAFKSKGLEELSQSIRAYGVLQPINVRQIRGDSYELIAGERRLRAAKLAGLKEMPAIVLDYRDKDSAMIALIENLQREDLNFIEEAEGYHSLISDHNYRQQDLAEKIGKSQSAIANKLRLLKLPRKIQRRLIDEELTERHGRALLKLDNDEERFKVLEEILDRGLNVKASEDLVAERLANLEEKKEKKEVKRRLKSSVSSKIYLNTIKKAHKLIRESGARTEYKEKEAEDHIEISIKIFK